SRSRRPFLRRQAGRAHSSPPRLRILPMSSTVPARPPAMRFRTLCVRAGLLMAMAAVLGACGPAEEEAGSVPAFLNVGETVAYVGAEACAQCHEEIYRSYQAHGMPQSFYR